MLATVDFYLVVFWAPFARNNLFTHCPYGFILFVCILLANLMSVTHYLVKYFTVKMQLTNFRLSGAGTNSTITILNLLLVTGACIILKYKSKYNFIPIHEWISKFCLIHGKKLLDFFPPAPYSIRHCFGLVIDCRWEKVVKASFLSPRT